MPIISFNVSDNLKKFLKKMVQQKEYKNSSNVIRDALVRLMSEKDGATGEVSTAPETFTDLSFLLPKLNASVMISIPKENVKLMKKINRLDIDYHKSIINKALINTKNGITVIYILEDDMNTIQSLITELNAFEDLKSFRYSIDDSEE